MELELSELTVERMLDERRAEAARVDDQLVAGAANEASYLARECEGWPPDRVQALAFGVALVALKGVLGPYSYAALRGRYEADRPRFTARLAAPGV